MIEKLRTMTNATKASLIAAINALFGILVAFDVILTQAQIGAIDTAINALLALFVAGTYQASAKRAPGA